MIVAISNDHGESWSDAVWVVDHPAEAVRAYDPNIWLAPDGKLNILVSRSKPVM